MTSDGHDPLAPLPTSATHSEVTGPSSGAEADEVTDEDRNRYGALLDRAAERNLLSPGEYQVRLGALADATSIDELQRIVTELPAFGGMATVGPAGNGPSTRSGKRGERGDRSEGMTAPADLDSVLMASRTPSAARKRHGNPWAILIVVLVALVVALVVLGLVATHFTHTHSTGTAAGVDEVISRLRL